MKKFTGKYNFKFKCRKCSACCREEGIIFFSAQDIKRASNHLKIKSDVFIKKYLKRGKKFSFIKVTKDKLCPFLGEKSCIIHDSKPEQCGSFPFWDEYIDDSGNLVNFSRDCPGIKII